MPCYNPIYAVPFGDINPESGKRRYKMLGSYDTFLLNDKLWLPDPDGISLPCGKCIGCRLDYSRRWADRMMLEFSACGKKAVFVTLTYDDDHIISSSDPDLFSGTLCKYDFQAFVKRLRERLRPICDHLRFYACGEYGTLNHRPHYHLILFGVSLDDFDDLIFQNKNAQGDFLFHSKLIDETWSKGFTIIGAVSWHTCAYVSRYVTKKLDGDLADLYDLAGVEPVFSLMSRRPGIGRPYLDQHPELFNSSKIPISDQSGSKLLSIPDYFIKSLEFSDPELYYSIKADRALYAENKIISELELSDRSYHEILRAHQIVKENKIKTLKRSL